MKAELFTLYLVWFPEGTAPRPTALCDLAEDSGTKASSAIWAMGGNLSNPCLLVYPCRL